jgi:starvation-inducible DNA-binding protein
MKTHEDTSMSPLGEKLNILLSSYQVTYNNIRSAHWMVKGENFFELHKFFETEYNDAALKADEIAERILTLGEKPVQLLSEMLELSIIKEKKVAGDQENCVSLLVHDFKLLGELENEIVSLADENSDVVTADIMTGYLRAQQKRIWMLSQFLSKKSKIQ